MKIPNGITKVYHYTKKTHDLPTDGKAAKKGWPSMCGQINGTFKRVDHWTIRFLSFGSDDLHSSEMKCPKCDKAFQKDLFQLLECFNPLTLVPDNRPLITIPEDLYAV